MKAEQQLYSTSSELFVSGLNQNFYSSLKNIESLQRYGDSATAAAIKAVSDHIQGLAKNNPKLALKDSFDAIPHTGTLLINKLLCGNVVQQLLSDFNQPERD